MKVTFVLPGGSHLPAGGPRMVFRYATALTHAGWSVTVVMPSALGPAPRWLAFMRRGRYWLWRFTRTYAPHTWMHLHPDVILRWVPNLDPLRAPPGDAVVATAVQTAEAVACWPDATGRKFYFIQGYETWDFPASRVEASWRLPLQKIAVSAWLCGLVMRATGERAEHLPNGLDHDAFGLDRPITDRRAPIVLWPHHPLASKGSPDALAALQQLAPDIPGLRLLAFGTAPAPRHSSLSIDYVRNPSQVELRRLYNAATVMIAPSHSEGWGLPACEALQCGCALAASDIGGHREFLRHEHNALLHVPGDVAGLRINVDRLLRNKALRGRLARQGHADMAGLRLAPAADRLQRILSTRSPDPP